MDQLLLGLSTAGVGMLVVFSGLVILIACIYGMTSITGKKKKELPKPEAAPLPVAEPVVEAQAEESADDLSLIAVITAAVAAVWRSEGNQTGFVVRRVRRMQSSTARARAARDEQMYSHL